MNRLARLAPAALAATLACCNAERPPPAAPAVPAAPAARAGAHAPVVAVVGGTVVAAPGAAPIRDGVVVIRDGRIAAVGPRGATAVPGGAEVIDAAGATVLAGFWNAHVHFSEPVWRGSASAPVDRLSDALQRTFTRWGFAHVVDTGSLPQDTIGLRRRIEAGELPGPSIRTAGIPLAPVKGTPIYVRKAGFRLPEPASPEQARAAVGEQAALGVDAIKIFSASFMGPGVKPPVMAADVVAAVVAEAHGRKLLVFAHPTSTAGLRAAVDAGVDVVLHTSPDGGPWPPGTAQDMVARRVSLVPTLKLWDWELNQIKMPPARVQAFQRVAVEQLRSFARAGGSVLFGTDVGYIGDPDTADELRHMTEAGMDFPALLASLTTSPAARFGAGDRTGRLEPGLDADLTIVEGDPAADPIALSRVRLTMRRGAILWRAR